MIHRAWQLGIRHFDTAPMYGHGASERRVGRGVADLPRDEIVLATKVGRLLRADGPPDPRIADGTRPIYDAPPMLHPVFDFSYDGVLRSLEESLRRLGIDRVDVVHIHDPDDHVDEALAGASRAVHRLRDEGVVRAIGVGANQATVLPRFAREGDFDCFLLANRYTLMDHASALQELVPLCLLKGIRLIVGGVFYFGTLSDPNFGAHRIWTTVDPARVVRVRRLRDVCARHAVPLLAAALQFPLGNPAVAGVLSGVKSVAELEENDRLMRRPIPADLWAELRTEGIIDEGVPVPG